MSIPCRLDIIHRNALKMISLPSDIVHENQKIREMGLSVAEHVKRGENGDSEK